MTAAKSRIARDFRLLPDALAQKHSLFAHLKADQTGVFLDYDGTITPINPEPQAAVLSEDMRTSIAQLAEQVTVAIVSGRNKSNVQDLVALPNLYYAGNHGFDIEGPRQNPLHLEVGLEWIPLLEKCYREAQVQLMPIQGVQFEPKKLTVTIHYRYLVEDQIKLVFELLHDIVSKYPQLKITTGKKVLEIRPNIAWDKGYAVLWLAKQLNLNFPESVLLYIGDDITDEDAFWALPQNGIGILVGNHSGDTYADYHLRDPEQVRIFLMDLTHYYRSGKISD